MLLPARLRQQRLGSQLPWPRRSRRTARHRALRAKVLQSAPSRPRMQQSMSPLALLLLLLTAILTRQALPPTIFPHPWRAPLPVARPPTSPAPLQVQVSLLRVSTAHVWMEMLCRSWQRMSTPARAPWLMMLQAVCAGRSCHPRDPRVHQRSHPPGRFATKLLQRLWQRLWLVRSPLLHQSGTAASAPLHCDFLWHHSLPVLRLRPGRKMCDR
mmetsp:Transcript_109397/g.193829  ORF Transcript_109397/g.193829 Transcript_109397/m.193829 type:complete len:213 (-) Transcript_109397:847-1485(-)